MSAPAAVRERPILFSGPMVRAILDGTKTQTRRVVKPQAPPQFPVGWVEGDAAFWSAVAVGDFPMWEKFVVCPYGQPGDRLWVRETWARVGHPERTVYRADPADDAQWTPAPDFRWKPSIHIPRAFSRLTMEVTGVRVERVQDISEADAIAEGVAAYAAAYMAKGNPRELTAVEQYQYLWDSLNASRGYGWDTNPWVWVVEFARVAA